MSNYDSSVGRLLLKVFLLSLVLVLLFGCQGTENHAYEDFPHIDHWDEVNEMTEALTILYFYSPTCQICMSIEEQVLDLVYDLQPHVSIYLINAGFIYEQGTPPVDIESVPSLIILEHGEFKELIRGPNDVVDYLENQRNHYVN